MSLEGTPSALKDPKAASLLFLYREIFGTLLDDPSITELAINRPGEIFYEQRGRWCSIEAPHVDMDMLSSFTTNVAVYNSQSFEAKTAPILSAVLPGGERLQSVAPPACPEDKMSITIRRPSFDVRVLKGYEESGFFAELKMPGEKSPEAKRLSDLARSFNDRDFMLSEPREVLEEMRSTFLKEAVRMQKNIVVAGETGSGKTTFMKALMQEIPIDERIITIEDVPELMYGLPNHRNQVNLLYPSEGKGAAQITAESLMKSCLRMKPDRILIAELRGGETFDWVNACLSGHGGSITSCHAGSCRAVFDYLALKILQSEAGSKLPNAVIRELLGLVIDVVIHMHNIRGHRYITEMFYNER